MLIQPDLAIPPRFALASIVVGRCLAEIGFPEDISISEATRRHRVLANPGAYSGPWYESPHFMLQLDRPMDCLHGASPYREVVVMGPSQTGKSEIGNNWDLHTILYDPADRLFVAPTQILTNTYVTTQFNKMLDMCEDLRKRQLSGPSSDNINLKQFLGCDLHFRWPTGSTFRAQPFSRGRGDDIDEMPTDIADQGDILSLMRGRDGSFAAFDETKIYLNSTPKLGRNKGIEALVAQGTDERLWVDCLQCAAPFALYIDRLNYDQSGRAADAAASAAVVCPDCGYPHRQADKRALMESFRWVGHGEEAVSRKIEPAGKTGELLPNRRASFRFDGLFGMRPWANIAELAREAEIRFEIEQDDAALKTFDQTVAGRNYVPRGDGGEVVTETILQQRAKAATWSLGEVPPGGLVLIAAIDQQANRFEVAVWAFGHGLRAWLVDRFALMSIKENGRERPVRPFTRAEDFAILHKEVLSRTYPLASAPHLRMKICNTVLDTGGLDSATDNAFSWWHSMIAGDVGSGRKALPPTAITLFKGGNKPKGRLLPPPTIDAKRQIKGVPNAEMFVPNVHRIKNIADVRLKQGPGEPGSIGFPHDVDKAHLAEMRAETLINGVWVRDSHVANETWDLYIMAYTAVLRFGGTDPMLSWVPAWARPPRGAPAPAEPIAKTEDVAADDSAQPVVKMQAPSAAARMARAGRRPRGIRTIRTA